MWRALLWIELCTTWWWWFAVLVPFAVMRQITIRENPHLGLVCLEAVMAGLGIASGLRDRAGIRSALSRHGTPWQQLTAKLVVPGVLIPIYYLCGVAVTHQVSERTVGVGNDILGWFSFNPAILLPIFLAGLATGLRQARWWGTRPAPLIAIATAIALIDDLMPTGWVWERCDTYAQAQWTFGLLFAAIAILLALLGFWWCLAAMRTAGGEDGPLSRLAAATGVALAALGIAMSPWLLINGRWEGMLDLHHVDAAGPGHPGYAQPLHPGLSWIRLRDADATWSTTPYGTHWLNGGFGNAHMAGTKAQIIVQGTEGHDGLTTMEAATIGLGLNFGIGAYNRWRNLSVTDLGSNGRVVQAPRLRDRILSIWGMVYHPWTYQNDPRLVRCSRDGPEVPPCLVFQIDSWSTPDLIIRPLTAADPPLLSLVGDLRIGYWADRLTWNVKAEPTVTIPHPFSPSMPGHIAIVPAEDADGKAYRIDYHWRPSPWSASRWRIVILSATGDHLSSADMPTADSQLVVQVLGLIGSPALAAFGLHLNRDNELTGRPWAAPTVLPWCLAGGLAASISSWFILAWRGCPPRGRVAWMAMSLVVGMAVPLAALAVYLPAAHRPCPTCGRRRWTDDARCPGCDSAWSRPQGQGREIHDLPHAETCAADRSPLANPQPILGA